MAGRSSMRHLVHKPPPIMHMHVVINYWLLLDYCSPALTRSDCTLQGVGEKLTTTVRVQHWQRKYFRLYSNRLEWADSYVVCMHNCEQYFANHCYY